MEVLAIGAGLVFFVLLLKVLPILLGGSPRAEGLEGCNLAFGYMNASGDEAEWSGEVLRTWRKGDLAYFDLLTEFGDERTFRADRVEWVAGNDGELIDGAPAVHWLEARIA